MLPELTFESPLERQLLQARRVACIPGQASPTCAALVDFSLRLAADAIAETVIRAEYEMLRQNATGAHG